MAKKRRFLPLAGLLAVWLAAGIVPQAAGAVDFSLAINYAVGFAPTSVAVGDFNGDGKLDLVTSNRNETASVLIGNGNGTFGAATSFPTGTVPQSVAVGDLNGDGKLDLVTANGGGSVSVLLGNGNGTFGAATSSPVLGGELSSVAVADFNGDGKLDLATANRNGGNGNTVSVLLGNGNGTFGVATTYLVAQGPSWVATGDFNGDGKLDIVAASSGSTNMSVLLGNGNGGFGAPTIFSVGVGTYSVGVADLNEDGKLDLATADFGLNTVGILLGNGNGSFGAPTRFSVGNAPASVAVADFNGDGKRDLATANFYGDNVSLLLGNGNGTFGEVTNFRVGLATQSVAVGDFNRDGKPDLVTANSNSGDVSVLLNTTGPPVDTTPPSFSCGSADGLWHASDVSIACTAQDSGSGLANPADANFLLSTNVPSGTETSNAATGTRNVCDTKGNCATAGPIAGNKVDKKAPTVSCGTADDQWHSANLSVACLASDGGSGVAPPADANFLLQTNVASGAESANASAAPRNVCDAVSNCTAATVPGGIKVDRKAPSITITAPEAARYLPRQTVTASYSCADGGSGVALCVGPVPSGSNIDTAPPAGPKTFTVFAADKTGNVSSLTVTYQIGTPGP